MTRDLIFNAVVLFAAMLCLLYGIYTGGMCP